MNQREHVPKSNPAAFGIWKSRNLDGLVYQTQLRTEWDGRLGTQKTALKEDK